MELSQAQMTEIQISKYVSELPSEQLKRLAKKEYQKFAWREQRAFYELLSMCWKARILGLSSPIAKALEDGILDKWRHDYIWRVIDKYQKLWALLQLSENDIKNEVVKLFGKYQFNSIRELFELILRIEADNDVGRYLSPCKELPCITPYKEFSWPMVAKAIKLEIKSAETKLSKKEQIEFERASKKVGGGMFGEGGIYTSNIANPWLRLVLGVSQKKSKTDLLTKDTLDDFGTSAKRVRAMLITASRKRYSKTWNTLRSFVIDNGEIRFAENGSYSRNKT